MLRTCRAPEGREPDAVSRWLLITRACVQPMTLTSAGIAGLLAVRQPTFDPALFLLAAVGIVVAHAANNMVNDYFDLDAGLDTSSYPRTQYAPHPVVAGLISQGGLRNALLLVNVIDAVIMLILLAARGWPIVGFALAGLFLSVFYVAPPLRLKARGLGEPSVFLIWGPLMVGGTYFAAVGALPITALAASVPYALLVTTVLMGKHMDKASWDETAGVRTLPVLLGPAASRRVTIALMWAFYAAILALVAAGALSAWSVVAVGAIPRMRETVATYSRPKPAERPRRFPLWPLWFGPWAFVHARRAGGLFVTGLALGAIVPAYL